MKVYNIKLNDGSQWRTLIENRNQEKRFQDLISELKLQKKDPTIDYDYCNGISFIKEVIENLDKGLLFNEYKRFLCEGEKLLTHTKKKVTYEDIEKARKRLTRVKNNQL